MVIQNQYLLRSKTRFYWVFGLVGIGRWIRGSELNPRPAWPLPLLPVLWAERRTEDGERGRLTEEKDMETRKLGSFNDGAMKRLV